MRAFAAVLASLAALPALSQGLAMEPTLRLDGISGFDSRVPTPEQVLGITIGARHTRADEITRYYEAVGAASPRVKLIRHGRSTGGRDLIHAVVSSPANLSRYKAFDPAGPLVVWIGYGVHGNEPSASEASIPVLHTLAAGQGPWITRLLERCIVILVPCLNPDGRDRHVTWLNANRGENPTTDAADREKAEPWPGGRVSHYWVDLNRDWLPLTQVESRTRHEVWRRWHPHVTLDYHEMGTPGYFFQPGVTTRVHPLTPRFNQDRTREFASYHARALEALGVTYFTEERFDDFYQGKGSTYPDLSGSLGILFEQANSRGLRGQVGGALLTYGEAVRNQVATTFSSLRASLDLEAKLKSDRTNFYASRPKPAWAAMTFRWEPGQQAQLRLIEVLLRHDIQVYRKGSEFMVPMDQPESRLIEAAFERRKSFEDDGFYDISSWSMDLAMGVPMEFLNTAPSMAGWSLVESTEALVPQVKLAALPKAYAYYMDWSGESAPTALSKMLTGGLDVKAVTRSMTLEGIGMAKPGDLIIRTTTDEQHAVLSSVYAWGYMKGARVRPIVPQPGAVYSLAGGRVRSLELPRVTIVTGTGAEATNAGEIWQLLDQDLGLTVTMADSERLTAAALARHSVVVLAGGAYPATLAERLTAWVRAGGRLIATASAVDWVSDNNIWKLETVRHIPATRGLPFGEIAEERGRHSVPGTIFQVDVDQTHPLAAALPKNLSVFRDSSSFVKLPTEPGVVVAKYSDQPLLAGYISAEAAKLVPGSAAMLAKTEGSGQIVLIADNIHFRGFFTAPDRMFVNALFLGGLL